jgi:hypothetical protein
MTWCKVIDLESSVGAAGGRTIGVLAGAMRDHLSPFDRRSAGILDQAVCASIHLTGSTSGEP